MASKQTYECYVCKRNNFHGVRVYLDGKTEDGRTIYKNEDMSPHAYKQQTSPPPPPPQQHGQGSTTIASESTQLKTIVARLEYAISLLEKITNTTT